MILRSVFNLSSQSARRKRLLIFLLPMLALASGCSVRRYAVNMVGDALASGNSVYENDEDLQLVGEALPFGLKLMESLLQESPDHLGLLLTSCRGFVLYSYAYVDYETVQLEQTDLDRARAVRARARKLYLRAFHYGVRGLEKSYPGFTRQLLSDPRAAVQHIQAEKQKRDLPFLYWSATALGLAISVSRNEAALLARLPEVEAMMDRALELNEGWDNGTLHEFKVQLAGAKVGEPDWDAIKRHYERALELSKGRHAGLYVAYAEAVSVPNQDMNEFRTLLDHALDVDPDRNPENRLANLIAHRRARWLLDHADQLILEDASDSNMKGGQP